MENVDKICPICRKHPITLPNGVCSVCYDKVKTQADWNTTEWGKIENHGLDAIIVLAKYILDEIEEQPTSMASTSNMFYARYGRAFG